MAASKLPTCHLLRIPRELRDEIYNYCLSSDEGYHYHAETNTLRYPDGTAINLGLIRTCKQVAAEAVELALSQKIITFKTHIARVAGAEGAFESSLTSMTCYLSSLLHYLNISMQDAALNALDLYATEEMARHVFKKYPQSGIGAQIKLLAQMKGQDRYVGTTRVVRDSALPMTHMDRQALQEALQYACPHFGISIWLLSLESFYWPRNIWNHINGMRNDGVPASQDERKTTLDLACSKISSTVWLPWKTPTAAQINEMRELVTVLKLSRYVSWIPDQGPPGEGKELRYYGSAASQSIHFLEMLPQGQRSRLRRLVIREDRRSCALPRCHAHGLIPYLHELPRLRIDHHVDMWSAIFLDPNAIMNWVNASRLPSRDPASASRLPMRELPQAAYNTIHWINEAMTLRNAGMPLSAYRLHLEANTATAQRVWNAIKRLAALASANQRRYHENEDHVPLFDEITPDNPEFAYNARQERRLVTCVRLILSGDSTVRLSCPIGTLEEFEEDAQRIGNELKDEQVNVWRYHAKKCVAGQLDAKDYDFTALHELYYDPFLE